MAVSPNSGGRKRLVRSRPKAKPKSVSRLKKMEPGYERVNEKASSASTFSKINKAKLRAKSKVKTKSANAGEQRKSLSAGSSGSTPQLYRKALPPIRFDAGSKSNGPTDRPLRAGTSTPKANAGSGSNGRQDSSTRVVPIGKAPSNLSDAGVKISGAINSTSPNKPSLAGTKVPGTNGPSSPQEGRSSSAPGHVKKVLGLQSARTVSPGAQARKIKPPRATSYKPGSGLNRSSKG